MICILLMPQAEVFAKCSQMQTWSISLHGPSGIISTVDTGEAQFVVGTETASDVFTVVCEGVMPRHAWVWISEAGMQVGDLGGGTLVNGYRNTERGQRGAAAERWQVRAHALGGQRRQGRGRRERAAAAARRLRLGRDVDGERLGRILNNSTRQ